MPNRRQILNLMSAAVAWSCLAGAAGAQSPTPLQTDGVKSEIYFGSDMGAGQSVSQQAWEEFLSEVVVPRFPAGLTLLEGLGRGLRSSGPLTRTRILIVIHPNAGDAQARLSEIEADYRKRFGSAGVFHIDQPVRIQQQQ